MDIQATKALTRRLNYGVAALALIATLTFGIAGGIDAWFMQLAATVVSAGLAMILALMVYTRQLETRRNHFRDLLSDYCEYLASEIPVKMEAVATEDETVSAGYVNPHLLTTIIAESDLTALLPDLVRLDQHVSLYSNMANILVEHGQQQKKMKQLQAVVFLRAAHVMQAQAEKIMYLLRHANPEDQDEVRRLARKYRTPGDDVLVAIARRQREGKVSDMEYLHTQLADRVDEDEIEVVLARLATLRWILLLPKSEVGHWFKITADGIAYAEGVERRSSKC